MTLKNSKSKRQGTSGIKNQIELQAKSCTTKFAVTRQIRITIGMI